MRRARVLATVNGDPEVIQQPKRHAAIQPRLGSIPTPAFLRTEQQQCLNRWDARIANFQRVVEAGDGTMEELRAAIEGLQDRADLRFSLTPSDRVGEESVEEDIGIVRATDFQVA